MPGFVGILDLLRGWHFGISEFPTLFLETSDIKNDFHFENFWAGLENLCLKRFFSSSFRAILNAALSQTHCLDGDRSTCRLWYIVLSSNGDKLLQDVFLNIDQNSHKMHFC